MLDIIFLICFSTIDLTPPYLKEWDSSIGKWRAFGDATANDETILLVPKIQNTVGALWTDAQLPVTNWSVEFDISVFEPNGFGGFVIWYIDEMSVLGPLYGGPSSFSGVAVIGSISTYENGHVMLDEHLVQSDDDKYDFMTAALPKSSAQIWLFDDETRFKVKLEFTDDIVSLYGKTKGDPYEIFDSQKVVDNIDYNYLGISALNDEYTSKIAINKIVFNPEGEAEVFEPKFSLSRTLSSIDINEKFVFERKKTALRNPKFKQMSLDMEIATQLHGNVTYFVNTNRDGVISAISNCVDVASELAKYKDLDKMINDNFQNFSQKWAKRKTKLSQGLQKMDAAILETINQTEALLRIFNGTIHDVFQHSKTKAVHFEEVLEEMNLTEMTEINTKVMDSTLVQFMIFTSIAEILCLIGLLMYFA